MPKDSPTSQTKAPAAGDDAAGSPFDDGVLDAAEKKRIRDMLASAVSFLASRRLLPAVLMRVGPMRVLLPIVWGLGFLRSKRWVAGGTFLSVGLMSLVMALGPEIQFETAEVEDDSDSTEASAEPAKVEKSKAKNDTRVGSFVRPKKAGTPATSTRRQTGGPSFREPIFPASDADAATGRAVRPAGAVAAENGRRGGVWLLGTIEAVDEGATARRTASTTHFSHSMQ